MTAANEMTNRTGEVSTEAEQTGRHAAEVRENATALGVAVGELRHLVIRVVRNSAVEVNRRSFERRDLDVPCRLTVGGQAHAARVVDLSEGGAHVRDGPTLQADVRGTCASTGWASRCRSLSGSARAPQPEWRSNLTRTRAKAFAGMPERLARQRAA
jgi:methyl-accepting chemotaxis protein